MGVEPDLGNPWFRTRRCSRFSRVLGFKKFGQSNDGIQASTGGVRGAGAWPLSALGIDRSGQSVQLVIQVEALSLRLQPLSRHCQESTGLAECRAISRAGSKSRAEVRQREH